MLNTALGERAARVMLLMLTVIAVVAALRYAQAVLAPFVFALVLGIVVSPLSDGLIKRGMPSALAATAMLVMTSAAVVLVFVILEPLVSLVVERLPRLQVAVENWLRALSGFLRNIESLSDQIETTVGAAPQEEGANVPSLSDALWLAPNIGAQVFIFIGTLFFFILTRSEIYKATGQFSERLFRADALVSRYFVAISIVNIGVGVAAGIALMILGVEYALLWGLAAGVLNYILYLGPMMIIGGLLVAGLVQFSGAFAFLPALTFLTVNIIEAQFITPLVVGQHVKMNPLVVFLAVVFGLWLWGPIGAIVALPVILWLGLLLRPHTGVAMRPKGVIEAA